MPKRRDVIGAVTAIGLFGSEAHAQARAPSRASRAPAAPAGTPATTPLGPVDTLGRQVLIIDADTGATLLEKSADERMTPSSMSKLMTAYVVFDLLKQGRLKMDQELPVSERAWRMGGSKMFVQINSSVKVDDLLHGVIIQSGNDACVVLAEGISGSEAQFAELMNDYAKRLELTNSTFRNATGWPDPEHKMTCRDLASLAAHIVKDFPEYFPIYSQRSFRWNEINQENRNPLLGRVAGADGMKTGHTDEAGYGLVGTVKRGERRLILVINGLPSMASRREEAERLMEWGFREFENVSLFRASDTIEEAPVYLGEQLKVPLVGGRDVLLTLPRQWRRNLQVKVRYDSPVPAPVAKGQELGKLEVSGAGVPPMTVPLLAGADVAKLGLIPRIPAVLGRMISGA
ncbi:D-alanyl-D-alanine carboxypeptidase family protein [Roseomonas populi]|uniref:serine-type D-Ala-D-Ala carboxypeptidase n=1 Tax=Roseomonas populi TaxID=3121582 RepID=A0ABT1X0V4_9PROT|nr:D-alanyl-D-alanine carboxypeptidase family protein [Roseomonas pecuniae]MCR0981421.1 D-alanyl-D-alanine carboxypeptidase [Roseomonas pecuniae]